MGIWARITGRLGRDDLAKEIWRRVRALGLEGTLDLADLRIDLGERRHISLQNIWAEYQRGRSRAERRALIDHFTASIVETEEPTPATFDEARPFLRPVVRERAYYESVLLRVPPGLSPQPAVQSLGAHLTVAVALDRPSSMMEVWYQHLDGWKVTLDEALDEAKKNLGRASHSRWPETAPGVFASPFGDSYDAARAALPHVIGALPVRGDPVALVLSRNHLFVTGADDPAGIAALAHLGKMAAELPRAMSAFPVRWTDSAWEPLELPLAEPFRALHYEWTYRNYEEQRAALERRGEGVRVAPFRVFKNEDGRLHSLTTWLAGEPNLLPRADAVHVTRPDAPHDSPIVPWERFVAILGRSLVAEPDRQLELWRTPAEPAPEILAELLAAAVGKATPSAPT